MTETAATLALQVGESAAKPPSVSIWEIFLEFLIIGATSFGGVVPYLRGSLVTKRHWIEDKGFLEMLLSARGFAAWMLRTWRSSPEKSCVALWAQSSPYWECACPAEQ
jgi:hypothetical protein